MFAQMIAVEDAARLALADFDAESGPERRVTAMSRIASTATTFLSFVAARVGVAWLI